MWPIYIEKVEITATFVSSRIEIIDMRLIVCAIIIAVKFDTHIKCKRLISHIKNLYVLSLPGNSVALTMASSVLIL